MLRFLNAPVIAFLLVVLGGWGISIYFDQWWWVAIGLTLGLLAGDIVEALLPQARTESAKRKGTNKD